MAKAIHTPDHSRPSDARQIICTGTESECRKAAAKALGRASLRGLTQCPTAHGISYYGAGSTDDDGESVEIVF